MPLSQFPTAMWSPALAPQPSSIRSPIIHYPTSALQPGLPPPSAPCKGKQMVKRMTCCKQGGKKKKSYQKKAQSWLEALTPPGRHFNHECSAFLIKSCGWRAGAW